MKIEKTEKIQDVNVIDMPAIETSEAFYTTRMSYDINDSLEYKGQAAAGSDESDLAWQIKKFTYDINGNLESILYPNGDKTFIYQWSRRAIYTYN